MKAILWSVASKTPGLFFLVALALLTLNVSSGQADPNEPFEPPNFEGTPTIVTPASSLQVSIQYTVIGTLPIEVDCQWQDGGTAANPGAWADIAGATACNNYTLPGSLAGQT